MTNSGARTGTILSLQLTAENLKTNQMKQFYSAFLGKHQVNADTPNRSFAPCRLRAAQLPATLFCFYPDGDARPKLIDDAGDFRFTLNPVTAQPRRSHVIGKSFLSFVQLVVFKRNAIAFRSEPDMRRCDPLNARAQARR